MLKRLFPRAGDPAAIENLESRRMMTSSYAVGINVNDNSSSIVPKATSVLKTLGVKTVRLWTSVSDFNNHSIGSGMQRAIDYSKAGFDVTLEVNTAGGKVPSASAVKGWFAWAANDSTLKNAVDHWEIGNEPDGSNYWDGSLSQYVTGYLKPAYEALHAEGEEVISAGPSYNPQDVQTMINAGLLNYTDYVGFHPYAKGASLVKQRIAEVNSIVAGRKPLAATEWNVRGYESNKTAWAQAVDDAYPYVKAGFDLNYYFCLVVQDSMAGPGGILKTSLALNQPFYNAFAGFSNTGTSNDNSGGGSTPGSSTATITGTLFNDTDVDGVFDSKESPTGSRTVFIDTDGNGKLDAGEKSTTSNSKGVYSFTGLAKGTYNVSRVFPSGYKLSNNSRGYLASTVIAGQKLTGVNIGTTYRKSTAGGSTTTPTPPTIPTGTTPAVTAIRLIDTATGAVIASYPVTKKEPVIALSSLPKNVSVEAVGNSATASMILSALGKKFVEPTAPFAFFGDTNGTFKSWSVKQGSYTFGATAYTGAKATGSKSTTTYMTLTFV